MDKNGSAVLHPTILHSSSLPLPLYLPHLFQISGMGRRETITGTVAGVLWHKGDQICLPPERLPGLGLTLASNPVRKIPMDHSVDFLLGAALERVTYRGVTWWGNWELSLWVQNS